MAHEVRHVRDVMRDVRDVRDDRGGTKKTTRKRRRRGRRRRRKRRRKRRDSPKSKNPTQRCGEKRVKGATGLLRVRKNLQVGLWVQDVGGSPSAEFSLAYLVNGTSQAVCVDSVGFRARSWGRGFRV